MPVLAILAAMIAQYAGAAVAKTLFPLVGPDGVAALRVGLSALLLVAVWQAWRARFSRRDILGLALYGAALGLMNVLIYRAIAHIPIGIAVAIEVTGPLAVAAIASRRPADLLWIGLAAGGLLALPAGGAAGIGADGWGLDGAGVAYAFGAAACWALYIVFGSRVAGLGAGRAVACGMAVAAAIAVPLGVGEAGAALVAPPVLLAGAAVALLSSVLPYTLEMLAMARLPRRVLGMLFSASPAVGAAMGWALLGESLGIIQWLGIACVMAACAGSAAASRETGQP